MTHQVAGGGSAFSLTNTETYSIVDHSAAARPCPSSLVPSGQHAWKLDSCWQDAVLLFQILFLNLMRCFMSLFPVALDTKSLEIVELIPPALGQGYNMVFGHKNLTTILERIKIEVKIRLIRILLFGKVSAFTATNVTANAAAFESLQLD